MDFHHQQGDVFFQLIKVWHDDISVAKNNHSPEVYSTGLYSAIPHA